VSAESPDFAPTRPLDAPGDADACPAAAEEPAAYDAPGRMPALFLGHGSPMNAIETNAFTRALSSLAEDLPRPVAVLVVSAHWLTRGETRVLSSAQPRTIHDFYGFPPELYEVEYPAPGSPGLAHATADLCGAACDDTWGLDHASWAVLRHVYPAADVPVFELSLDIAARPAQHVEIGRRLGELRDRGVLVVGSGNVVHNLRAIDWDSPQGGFDWAEEFDSWAAGRIEEGDVDALADYESLGRIAQLAVPTNEHYLPLLYAMALKGADEPMSTVYAGMEYGSLSMRCVRVG